MRQLKYTTLILLTLIFGSHFALGQEVEGNKNLMDHLFEFSQTSSVTGREEQAAFLLYGIY